MTGKNMPYLVEHFVIWSLTSKSSAKEEEKFLDELDPTLDSSLPAG